MPTYKAKWRVDCNGKTYEPGAELPERVVDTLKEAGAHAVVETIEDPEPVPEKPKKEAAKAPAKPTKADADKTEGDEGKK